MGTGRSGVGGGGVNGSKPSMAAITKTIDKTPFKDYGGGQWVMDSPFGGVQVLDETGSSRALQMGYLPNEKVYSVTWWGSDSSMSNPLYFDRLSDAKQSGKQILKSQISRNRQD